TTAQRLADEMADAGTVDLYEAFGERLALSVLCEVLGVPPVDHGSMAAWIAPMAECLGNPTPERRVAADEAMVEFAGYVMSLIEERRLQPGSDLLSRLIEAEERGERLTNQELVA